MFVFAMSNATNIVAYSVELDSMPSYYGHDVKPVSRKDSSHRAGPILLGLRGARLVIPKFDRNFNQETNYSLSTTMRLAYNGIQKQLKSMYKKKRHSMCRYLIQHRA